MVLLKWGALEVFKFSLYISIPISMVFGLVRQPDNLDTICKTFNYVDYPPEGPKPPTLEEMKDIMAKRNA